MLVLTFATKKKDGSRQKTVQLSLEVRLQKQDLQTVKNQHWRVQTSILALRIQTSIQVFLCQQPVNGYIILVKQTQAWENSAVSTDILCV